MSEKNEALIKAAEQAVKELDRLRVAYHYKLSLQCEPPSIEIQKALSDAIAAAKEPPHAQH